MIEEYLEELKTKGLILNYKIMDGEYYIYPIKPVEYITLNFKIEEVS